MSKLKHPNGEFILTAQKHRTDASDRQVDVPIIDHQGIQEQVEPLMQELDLNCSGEWVPQGLRLTFGDEYKAMKFRLHFRERNDQ